LSVLSPVSQPSIQSLSQFAYPEEHEHAPMMHAAFEPQLTPVHGSVVTQLPFWHCLNAGQAFPQLPQLAFELRLTSQPFDGLISQLANPEGHPRHLPDEHMPDRLHGASCNAEHVQSLQTPAALQDFAHDDW
jgi:hypothetical protein